MCDVVREASEEVAVVASVLEELTHDGATLAREHVASLVRRLRDAAARLASANGPTAATRTTTRNSNDAGGGGDADERAMTSAAGEVAAAATRRARSVATVRNASSIHAVRVPRAMPPRDAHTVARDVTRVLTSTLYNMLESLTRLLAASRASVLVRRDDDMVAIVNVAPQLHFPPQLTRHRCMGAADAEVLASGVALSQHMVQARGNGGGGSAATTPAAAGTLQPRSLLLFPVHAPAAVSSSANVVAVLSVEDKARGTAAFDAHDEALVYVASLLIGELLTRVPHFDWVSHFYDPVTQHLIAPFVLPSSSSQQQCSGSSHALPLLSATHTDVMRRLAQHRPEVLIRRQAVSATGRVVRTPAAPSPDEASATQLPSLREVDAYVANVQHCWKTSVASNVALMEGGREMQNELRSLRRALAETQAALSHATQRLRLYELDTTDYRREYKDLHSELDIYFGKATSPHMTQ